MALNVETPLDGTSEMTYTAEVSKASHNYKTYTITQRIFYLIEKKKIPPEKILVVTFTKDAALSMQSRFRQLSDTIYPVPFGTFHSIFYTILKESHIQNFRG